MTRPTLPIPASSWARLSNERGSLMWISGSLCDDDDSQDGQEVDSKLIQWILQQKGMETSPLMAISIFLALLYYVSNVFFTLTLTLDSHVCVRALGTAAWFIEWKFANKIMFLLQIEYFIPYSFFKKNKARHSSAVPSYQTENQPYFAIFAISYHSFFLSWDLFLYHSTCSWAHRL